MLNPNVDIRPNENRLVEKAVYMTIVPVSGTPCTAISPTHIGPR